MELGNICMSKMADYDIVNALLVTTRRMTAPTICLCLTGGRGGTGGGEGE